MDGRAEGIIYWEQSLVQLPDSRLLAVTWAYDEKTGKPKTRTAHSLNPVFAYVYEPAGQLKMKLSAHKDLGISSLAATCLTLLGFEPPDDYTPSIVEIKRNS